LINNDKQKYYKFSYILYNTIFLFSKVTILKSEKVCI
jgi:hypothetical protein